MTGAATQLDILTDCPIKTWFGVGGRADRFATVHSLDELRAALEIDPDLLILGDGANLLVADEGVSNLVISLDAPELSQSGVDDDTGLYVAGGGLKLPRLIQDTIKLGLAGLETLGGIPATVGGATAMNAGGAFGQIADHIIRVHALDRAGRAHAIDRSKIDFGYRQSRLNHLLITAVEFDLAHGDPEALRLELKRVMAYKKDTQPLADHSAGCVFRNPTLTEDTEGLGISGERISAGLMVDRAGCKGMTQGGATVSDQHANFIITTPQATAADVLGLIGQIRQRVLDTFGVELDLELVVWDRGG